MYFFFFFQAEDGIRDGRVTGVQTCALPISVELFDFFLLGLQMSYTGEQAAKRVEHLKSKKEEIEKFYSELAKDHAKAPPRSEERRVGKECRTRWALDQ